MKKGCKFGTHRVIEPVGSLPQGALKISNDMEIMSNTNVVPVWKLTGWKVLVAHLLDSIGH